MGDVINGIIKNRIGYEQDACLKQASYSFWKSNKGFDKSTYKKIEDLLNQFILTL